MQPRDVAASADVGRCPCCGSDPSRFELFLDNGFGFELYADRDEAGASWGTGETEPTDFGAFYLERRGFFAQWLMDAEAELGPSDFEDWNSRARAAFARGIEHEARSHGVDMTATDVAADLIEIEIEMRIVYLRLGPDASVEEIAAEYMNMVRNGLTAEEEALVTRLREGIAGAIGQNRHVLSRQIAQRLRDPGRSFFAFRQWRVVGNAPAVRTRRSGVRATRSRRHVHRTRSRSPGRSSRPADDPHEHDDLVLGGRL